jgi:hypothetical protein
MIDCETEAIRTYETETLQLWIILNSIEIYRGGPADLIDLSFSLRCAFSSSRPTVIITAILMQLRKRGLRVSTYF